MISLVDYLYILQFLQTVVMYLHRRCRFRALQQHDGTMGLLFFGNFLNMIFNFLRMFVMYVRLKSRRQHPHLYKPHLMLQLMQGYRVHANSQDLWMLLQRNWINFFWLTGETPQTLSILVNKLRNNFHTFNNLGCNSVLDFRNQVSYMHASAKF